MPQKERQKEKEINNERVKKTAREATHTHEVTDVSHVN